MDGDDEANSNADSMPSPPFSSSDEDGVEGRADFVTVGTVEETAEHTFDTALPMKHTYLGTDLEEVRGRTLLDDDSLQTLPLLLQPGVVLVPGQTLPLSVLYVPTITMLRNCIATTRTFGVVCVRYINESGTLANIGTTAEIYEYQNEEEGYSGFRVKAKGRQRFQIVDRYVPRNGTVTARVKILPEAVLPDPLWDCRIESVDRLRGTAHNRQLEKRDAIVTRWPSWVYAQYQSKNLVQRMKKKLQESTGVDNPRMNLSIPSDPVDLSYWVAHNLPLHDEHRLDLLRIDSPIQRLRWELSFLEKCGVLACRDCHTRIALQEDVFSMSVEGPQGTYVNPGGYVHETLTLHRAKGLRVMQEDPSTEFTWFPGYAWTIAICRGCRKHMGWQFTATNDDLKPNKFWGVCRSSIQPELLSSDDDNYSRPIM